MCWGVEEVRGRCGEKCRGCGEVCWGCGGMCGKVLGKVWENIREVWESVLGRGGGKGEMWGEV